VGNDPHKIIARRTAHIGTVPTFAGDVILAEVKSPTATTREM